MTWRRDRPLAGSSGEWITPYPNPRRQEAAGPGTRSDRLDEVEGRTNHVGKNKTWMDWYWTRWLLSGLLLTSECNLEMHSIRDLMFILCGNTSWTSYHFKFPLVFVSSIKSLHLWLKALGACNVKNAFVSHFKGSIVYRTDAAPISRPFTSTKCILYLQMESWSTSLSKFFNERGIIYSFIHLHSSIFNLNVLPKTAAWYTRRTLHVSLNILAWYQSRQQLFLVFLHLPTQLPAYSYQMIRACFICPWYSLAQTLHVRWQLC